MTTKEAAGLLLACIIVGCMVYQEASGGEYPPNLVAPNDAGGEIVLTFQPCFLQIAEQVRSRYLKKGEPLYYAYSTNPLGRAHACWFSPEFIPEEALPGAEPVVNLAAENGYLFPHLISEFSVQARR